MKPIDRLVDHRMFLVLFSCTCGPQIWALPRDYMSRDEERCYRCDKPIRPVPAAAEIASC